MCLSVSVLEQWPLQACVCTRVSLADCLIYSFLFFNVINQRGQLARDRAYFYGESELCSTFPSITVKVE